MTLSDTQYQNMFNKVLDAIRAVGRANESNIKSIDLIKSKFIEFKDQYNNSEKNKNDNLSKIAETLKQLNTPSTNLNQLDSLKDTNNAIAQNTEKINTGIESLNTRIDKLISVQQSLNKSLSESKNSVNNSLTYQSVNIVKSISSSSSISSVTNNTTINNVLTRVNNILATGVANSINFYKFAASKLTSIESLILRLISYEDIKLRKDSFRVYSSAVNRESEQERERNKKIKGSGDLFGKTAASGVGAAFDLFGLGAAEGGLLGKMVQNMTAGVSGFLGSAVGSIGVSVLTKMAPILAPLFAPAIAAPAVTAATKLGINQLDEKFPRQGDESGFEAMGRKMREDNEEGTFGHMFGKFLSSSFMTTPEELRSDEAFYKSMEEIREAKAKQEEERREKRKRQIRESVGLDTVPPQSLPGESPGESKLKQLPIVKGRTVANQINPLVQNITPESELYIHDEEGNPITFKPFANKTVSTSWDKSGITAIVEKLDISEKLLESLVSQSSEEKSSLQPVYNMPTYINATAPTLTERMRNNK